MLAWRRDVVTPPYNASVFYDLHNSFHDGERKRAQQCQHNQAWQYTLTEDGAPHPLLAGKELCALIPQGHVVAIVGDSLSGQLHSSWRARLRVFEEETARPEERGRPDYRQSSSCEGGQSVRYVDLHNPVLSSDDAGAVCESEEGVPPHFASIDPHGAFCARKQTERPDDFALKPLSRKLLEWRLWNASTVFFNGVPSVCQARTRSSTHTLTCAHSRTRGTDTRCTHAIAPATPAVCGHIRALPTVPNAKTVVWGSTALSFVTAIVP